MLAVNNLTISFGGRYLFDGICFNVNPEDRIGLIGRNGTGKSTLLKLISGLEQPEEGTVSKPNDFIIGYLPQEGIVISDKTVFDEAKSALGHILELDKHIHQLTDEMSNRTDYDSAEYAALIDKVHTANEQYKIIGGLTIEAQVESVLLGLGFSRTDYFRKVTEFSGGWQMRIELAKILLRKPDLILLDEPTNHLDIDSIQWIENYLRVYPGAIIIVSHDRNFLNNVTNRTIEIASGKIYDMSVSYNEFMLIRDDQREHQMNAFLNQQKQIKETERFIERFRSKATLASRVQSRIKALEKVERIELEDVDNSGIDIRFPAPPRSSRLIVEAKSLSKSYGPKLILDRIDFAIEREEKIAFVGKNGEGKSTISRIIAGLESYNGELVMGSNISIGYYAQHQAELLNGDDTVFDVIDRAATGDMRSKVRSLLGAFLFSGDSVYKKVRILSGGEKSRLALAKMLLQPVNFLILDEPTNHLDMVSKDILKKALLEFTGAIVIVSHDREFLSGLTNKTILFQDRKIKEYMGDIYYFLDKHSVESLSELESNKKTDSGGKDTQPQGKDKIAREQQKTIQREENKLKKQIQQCEEEITKLEESIAAIEKEFENPDFFLDIENSRKSQQTYNELRARLEAIMNDWSDLHEQYDTFRMENEIV